MKPHTIRPSIGFVVTGRMTLRMRVGLGVLRLGSWLVKGGGVEYDVELRR